MKKKPLIRVRTGVIEAIAESLVRYTNGQTDVVSVQLAASSATSIERRWAWRVYNVLLNGQYQSAKEALFGLRAKRAKEDRPCTN
jgi:hypothetical protein